MQKNSRGLQKSKVFLVEDSPIAARVARIILETKGFEVDCVTTGEEAIEKMNAAYSFVLLDIGLPGIDGFEVAIKIRKSQQAYSTIPIFALTAHIDSQEKIDLAKEVVMNGYLSKPFTPALCDLLIERLEDAKNHQHFLMAM